jgi:hypothetical protein
MRFVIGYDYRRCVCFLCAVFWVTACNCATVGELILANPIWGVGLEYQESDDKPKEQARREKYAAICAKTYACWLAGATQAHLAEKYGVRRRQIAARLEKHRSENNLPNGRHSKRDNVKEVKHG